MDNYLTIEEVAELLRVHRNTAYRYVRSGAIPSIRIGVQWRVKESDLPQSKAANHDTNQERNELD